MSSNSGGFGEEAEEDHGDDEIWLISYADLMTLLFGFFVLMYVFASSNTGNAEKVKEGLAKSFGGTYVAPQEELAEQLAQKMDGENHPIMKSIDVSQPKDGLEITFRSHLLFRSGRAKLRPDVIKTLKMVAKLVSKNVENAEVLVSGHTDDAPINTRVFPSNWELSGSRASSVVREFIDAGFNPKMLIAQGYADSRPAYPNRDSTGRPIPENRQRNRRVVIKVVSPHMKTHSANNPTTKEDGKMIYTGDSKAKSKVERVAPPPPTI